MEILVLNYRFLCLTLHKFGGGSAIEASFIALILHKLCISLAAVRQLKQVSLCSPCTNFAQILECIA